MDDLQKREKEKSDGDKSSANASISPAKRTTTVASDPVAYDHVSGFLTAVGAYNPRLPGESSERKDFYSDLLSGLIKVDTIARGRVTCLFSVAPAVLNMFDGLHGGTVGMLAERVAVACARTVVAKDKELFLSDLSLSYLSSASLNEELKVESLVAKTGRNVTVITIEITRKQNRKLLYLSHATFFHSPIAKL